MIYADFLRYKTEKVWDKNSRLDIVFGSTGNETGILQFMEDVDQRIREARFDEETTAADDSDSSEDEDTININANPLVSLDDRLQKVQEESRSTHFLAIRIANPGLLQRLMAVQKLVVESDPNLADCCMKEGLFHITLGMLRIPETRGILAAVDTLEGLAEEFKALTNGRDTDLHVRNLNNFGHRVLYAEVHPADPVLFQDLLRLLKAKFEPIKESVMSTNSFEFVPHVTLVKVSRPIARVRNSQYIDQGSYQEAANEEFGVQALDNLQLCIIEASTRFDGFYTTLADIKV